MGKAEATTISFINMEALYEGDCLEIMRALPSESVDMIFADPPFNVGKKYGGKSDTDKRSDYYEWCARWINDLPCWRVDRTKTGRNRRNCCTSHRRHCWISER
jgi:DNA modification methylase